MTGRQHTHSDVIVIGAGAAGLMTALTAGQHGKRVTVLEHNQEPGRKILISGGGRCNFTNLQTAPDRFLSQNRHFVRSALARFKPADFLKMVEKHRIAWHEKTLGQLFCDESARQILAMLLDECAAGDVALRTGVTIRDVRHTGRFVVETSHGTFEAPALVLACGGLSIPKLGATGLAHRIARQFDVPVVPCRPGLVPFRIEDEAVHALAGVSLPVSLRSGKTAFREALLFTHRGISGPAVLQISSYWSPGETLTADFLPGQDLFALLKEAKTARSRAHGTAILSGWLPRRLAESLAPGVLGEKAAGEWPDKMLRRAATELHGRKFIPTETEGYAKAEVTVGGIDTRALSSATMEASSVPGLFVVGEAMDVTGWLGGYNFHWAWASGHAAGMALAR